MKKNAIIGALVLISALSLGYGYTQKIHADEMSQVAHLNEQIAKKAEAQAKEFQRVASELQLIAEHQAAEASAALQRAQEAFELATKVVKQK